MKGEDRKILEWCGFKKRGEWWDVGEESIPNWELDLDIKFYFTYAMPELTSVSMSWGEGLRCMFILELGSENRAEGLDEDPAEAFRQALLQIIQEEKE